MARQGQRAIAYSPILQKGELRFAREVNGWSLLSPQHVTDMPSDEDSPGRNSTFARAGPQLKAAQKTQRTGLRQPSR